MLTFPFLSRPVLLFLYVYLSFDCDSDYFNLGSVSDSGCSGPWLYARLLDLVLALFFKYHFSPRAFPITLNSPFRNRYSTHHCVDSINCHRFPAHPVPPPTALFPAPPNAPGPAPTPNPLLFNQHLLPRRRPRSRTRNPAGRPGILESPLIGAGAFLPRSRRPHEIPV